MNRTIMTRGGIMYFLYVRFWLNLGFLDKVGAFERAGGQ